MKLPQYDWNSFFYFKHVQYFVCTWPSEGCINWYPFVSLFIHMQIFSNFNILVLDPLIWTTISCNSLITFKLSSSFGVSALQELLETNYKWNKYLFFFFLVLFLFLYGWLEVSTGSSSVVFFIQKVFHNEINHVRQ